MNAHEIQFLMTQEKNQENKRSANFSNATLKNLGEGHFLSEIAQ